MAVISGDPITLTTFNNLTIKVKVTSSTVYKDATRSVNSVALKMEDLAVVIGSTSSDGTVTASTLIFGVTPPGRPGN